MLLRIDSEKVILIAVVVGLFLLVGRAQARIDGCKDVGQKTLSCVLQL